MIQPRIQKDIIKNCVFKNFYTNDYYLMEDPRARLQIEHNF